MQTKESFEVTMDTEINTAWQKFLIQNNICDDDLKSAKIAFQAGWKSREKMYQRYYCDDGK